MAGLEVLFCAVQSQINVPSDALVCCLHWNIVASGFKCIGCGEKPSSQNVKKSELLPSGWSQDSNLYTLLYVPSEGEEPHLLKVILMDGSLLVHFMRLSDEKAASMNIRISDYTTEDLHTFDSALKNTTELEKKFKKEILDETKTTSEASTSQSSQGQRSQSGRRSEDDDPLRVGPRRGPGGRYGHQPEWADPGDPFAVGRGDLDPLAGGVGGGMMMDPFRQGGFPGVHPNPNAGLPGRLPPGAIPPGARFDPFGPDGDEGRPRRGGRPGPGPDHLPPPGFGDDMFM